MMFLLVVVIDIFLPVPSGHPMTPKIYGWSSELPHRTQIILFGVACFLHCVMIQEHCGAQTQDLLVLSEMIQSWNHFLSFKKQKLQPQPAPRIARSSRRLYRCVVVDSLENNVGSAVLCFITESVIELDYFRLWDLGFELGRYPPH